MDKSETVVLDSDELHAGAATATSWEHELSQRQTAKVYSKAIGWSILLSTAIIMEGYDGKLIGSSFAQPAFQRAFGTEGAHGSYEVPAAWQSGLNNASNVAQIIGLVIGGWLSERFGFRKTMLWGLLFTPCPVFIYFFATNLKVLIVGHFLLGIPQGVFQSVTSVYAMEVMPTALRVYLTSYVDMCWIMGQFLSACIMRGTLNLPSPWTYRVPFAIQWVWPVFLVFGVYFAPDSPWWLVRQDRLEEAESEIKRLTYPIMNFDSKKNLAMMVVTTKHEREANSNTQYWSCFKGTDLRRTIIVAGCYSMQVTTGGALRGYMTYFFTQAGLPTTQSFNMSIVGYGIGVIGVFCSWFLMSAMGRRTLLLWGTSVSVILFLIVGGLGVQVHRTPSAASSWAIGGLLLADSLVANLTIQPISFALISEIPSSLLRTKSIVVARFVNIVINIISSILTPYMLNSSAWNWGAMTGFFWGGACFLSFLFTFFLVPEPRGRTVAELDLLFERKTPTRKFPTASVDVSEITEEM